jgi:hypothetical protein
MKSHNEQYRKEPLILRRRAVVWLRDQGHDFRSIGYAVGKTPEFARATVAKNQFRISQAARAVAVANRAAAVAETVKKYTVQPNT